MDEEGDDKVNKDQIIKIAVEAGVKAAIEHIEKQKAKESRVKRDKRLHNTKLLLRNYNLFKKHCEKSIYKIQQPSQQESANAILDSLDDLDGSAFIESIKKSVTKTYIIIAHIDQMLELYRIYCDQSSKEEDRRRYKIIRSYYFDDVKMSEIAKAESVDERTCYRDITDGCRILGSLMFGLESLTDVS
jgi:predicted DNA-binding protein YlxM (UPF0122 family)